MYDFILKFNNNFKFFVKNNKNKDLLELFVISIIYFEKCLRYQFIFLY